MRFTAKASGLLRTLPAAAVVAGVFTGVALLVGTGALAIYYPNSNANGSNIHNSNITDGSFNNSNISNSNVTNSNIIGSNINSSNINGSNVIFTNTLNSTINNSGVYFSNVTGSNVSNASIGEQDVCNTNITGQPVNTGYRVDSVDAASTGYIPTCPQAPPQPTTNNTPAPGNNAAAAPVTIANCANSFSIRGPFTNEPSLDGRFTFAAGLPGTYQVCISGGVIAITGPANAVVTIAASGSHLSTTVTLTNGSASIATSKVPS